MKNYSGVIWDTRDTNLRFSELSQVGLFQTAHSLANADLCFVGCVHALGGAVASESFNLSG